MTHGIASHYIALHHSGAILRGALGRFASYPTPPTGGAGAGTGVDDDGVAVMPLSSIDTRRRDVTPVDPTSHLRSMVDALTSGARAKVLDAR